MLENINPPTLHSCIESLKCDDIKISYLWQMNKAAEIQLLSRKKKSFIVLC